MLTQPMPAEWWESLTTIKRLGYREAAEFGVLSAEQAAEMRACGIPIAMAYFPAVPGPLRLTMPEPYADYALSHFERTAVDA